MSSSKSLFFSNSQQKVDINIDKIQSQALQKVLSKPIGGECAAFFHDWIPSRLASYYNIQVESDDTDDESLDDEVNFKVTKGVTRDSLHSLSAVSIPSTDEGKSTSDDNSDETNSEIDRKEKGNVLSAGAIALVLRHVELPGLNGVLSETQVKEVLGSMNRIEFNLDEWIFWMNSVRILQEEESWKPTEFFSNILDENMISAHKDVGLFNFHFLVTIKRKRFSVAALNRFDSSDYVLDTDNIFHQDSSGSDRSLNTFGQLSKADTCSSPGSARDDSLFIKSPKLSKLSIMFRSQSNIDDIDLASSTVKESDVQFSPRGSVDFLETPVPSFISAADRVRSSHKPSNLSPLIWSPRSTERKISNYPLHKENSRLHFDTHAIHPLQTPQTLLNERQRMLQENAYQTSRNVRVPINLELEKDESDDDDEYDDEDDEDDDEKQTRPSIKDTIVHTFSKQMKKSVAMKRSSENSVSFQSENSGGIFRQRSNDSSYSRTSRPSWSLPLTSMKSGIVITNEDSLKQDSVVIDSNPNESVKRINSMESIPENSLSYDNVEDGESLQSGGKLQEQGLKVSSSRSESKEKEMGPSSKLDVIYEQNSCSSMQQPDCFETENFDTSPPNGIFSTT
eukprot:CAMPEP_0182432202 /NCGR_PEP_ID=MMETSP1167-20130531/54801_1 /TAXON_ID=2988 /ORGANISM="Mallomonas Sp, Strain CCMP3275" /LENGTH=621 /DNA_ID=CAMNT_0024619427 /DNA_START=357 /DNA_END=2222 /DNA_ORIENTATION=-